MAGKWEEGVSVRRVQAVEWGAVGGVFRQWRVSLRKGISGRRGAVGGGCKQWGALASERVDQWEESGAQGEWNGGRRVGK